MGYTGRQIGARPYNAAKLYGDNTKIFKASDAVNKDEVVTKKQLDYKLSPVASSVLLNQSSVSLDNYINTKNFSLVLYTGNGTIQDIVTGIDSVDFTQANNGSGYWLDRSINQVKDDAGNAVTSGTADWGTNKGVSKVHFKNRDSAWFNQVYDGLRGATKCIYTNSTDSEITPNDYLTGFTSNGFTVDFSASGSTDKFIAYQTLYTHVSWGLTSHNQFYVEAYNPVTKEGMIYYIGSGNSGHQIPHSMGIPLEYIERKGLQEAVNWEAGIQDFSMILNLNNTAGSAEYDLQYVDYINASNGANDWNTSSNQYISYYKCKSETFTIGTYVGTGASGNFIETKDVNGVTRKPSMVIIKGISEVGRWRVLDTTRGVDNRIFLEDSIAEVVETTKIDITNTGFNLNTNSTEINTAGQTYLYMVEFDTNAIDGTPDGSYFKYITDNSDLNVTNGIFNFTNGKDYQGFKTSSLEVTKTFDFTGVTDGLKWIGIKEDSSVVIEDKKPSIGIYSKEYADDNRLVFKDGQWYSTSGGELVTNGTFDVDTSGWVASNNADGLNTFTVNSGETITLDQGALLLTGSTADYPLAYTDIDLVGGETYSINVTLIDNTGANGPYVRLIKYSDANRTVYIGYDDVKSLANLELGTSTYSYTAESAYYRLIIMGTITDNQIVKFDNITVYKLEPTLSTTPLSPISFMRNPVMITSETPQYIDYTDEIIENVMTTLQTDKVISKDLVVTDSFDLGQKWVDETANRALGVTYINTTGKDINILITCVNNNGGVNHFGILVDDKIVTRTGLQDTTLYTDRTLCTVVPNNSTYICKVFYGTVFLQKWFELT